MASAELRAIIARYGECLQALTLYKPPSYTTNAFNFSDLDATQLQAVDMAIAGGSFILTGAAGTGKTFTVVAIYVALMMKQNRHRIPLVMFRDPQGNTKCQEEKPAIVSISTTNRAVNNLSGRMRQFVPIIMEELAGNFMTLAKYIEVAPVFYDKEDGSSTMRFEPRRDESFPIPCNIIILEESSICDVAVNWKRLHATMLQGTQVILLGDLNQMPPVFGDSVLVHALRSFPIVELTKVHRTALDSPVTRQMHRILKGHTPTNDTLDFKVSTPTNKTPMGVNRFGGKVSQALRRMHNLGGYNPSTDILLLPWNKGDCGTIRLNLLISSWMDDLLHEAGTPRIVYEIQSAMYKKYYAVGDIVYDGVNKSIGTIRAINTNGTYLGRSPRVASTTLSRYGTYRQATDDDIMEMDLDDDICLGDGDLLSAEALLAMGQDDLEEATRQASHTIEILHPDGDVVTLATAAEINAMDYGYALTVNKAQGCEWDKVIIAFHESHFSTNREWLYTAGTRAAKSCIILTTEVAMQKTMARQRLKGNTIAEKVAWFTYTLAKQDNPTQCSFDNLKFL